MSITILDPTHESVVAGSPLAARLPWADHALGMEGKTVGVISNGKEGTKGFFKHLDTLLREDFGAADVVHRVKSSYSAPADAHIMAEARASWDVVISGIGD